MDFSLSHDAILPPFPDLPPLGPVSGVRDPFSSPYGMTDAVQDVEYAGFFQRLGALIIDSLMIFLVIFIFAFTISMLGARGSTPSVVILILIMILIILFYFPAMESSERQATYGKRAMKIYLTDMNGARISFWRALGRMLAKSISGIFYIGYIIQPFTEKKQALHDILAGTLVVKE